MSYISAISKGEEVIVWERTEDGREVKTYQSPHYYFIEDDAGEYVSMFGIPLTKLEFRTRSEFNQSKQRHKNKGVTLYESDISPMFRVLSENYYDIPAPKLNISFLDIEVDYSIDLGFSSIENPYAPINAIAFFHTWKKEYTVFAVPPSEGNWIEEHGEDFNKETFVENLNTIAPIDEDFNITFFKTEKQLLLAILSEIEDSDVLCGWNSDMFDIPYIAKRIELVLGKKHLRRLSFDGAYAPKYNEIIKYGNTNIGIELSGRESLDYLMLFIKYEMTKRASYKLESVANDIVPDLPKLSYEGTLASLYKNDFLTFIRYNIRDTEILYGFEKKLGYVELANQMYHSSTGLMPHVPTTLKLAELAINNYCHHVANVRVCDKTIPDTDDSIQGAYVLEPKRGMHSWIGSIDINSLYPSAIRALNISPETLIGQFTLSERASDLIISNDEKENIILEYEDGTNEEMTAKEWRQTCINRKWAVSGFGTVFDQNKKGIVPAVVEQWTHIRKYHQKLMYDFLESGDDDDALYHDRLQYVFKIKLNSLYGALCNKYFRFYDLRMGESTTAVSRHILKHQCATANKALTDEYVMDGDAIIYGDTDSTYFNTYANDEKEAIAIADAVCDVVNAAFKPFMQKTFICHPGFDDVIKAGREIVASSGIFVDKKRYILRVINNEGKSVDKLKVMGLETKKTTLPQHVSNKLNSFVERLLMGDDWLDISERIVEYKQQLTNSVDLMQIGLPKGVNNVEAYTREYDMDGKTRLPGHVAASILYNKCLDDYGDKSSIKITSGMKIKVFYLKTKIGRFKAIAIPTDIERVPSWFIDNFEIDTPAHIIRLVDKPLGNIIGAIGKEIPSSQSLSNDSLLGY